MQTMPYSVRVVNFISSSYSNRKRRPTAAAATGIRVHEAKPAADQFLGIVDGHIVEIHKAFGVANHFHAFYVERSVPFGKLVVQFDVIAQTRTAAAFYA